MFVNLINQATFLVLRSERIKKLKLDWVTGKTVYISKTKWKPSLLVNSAGEQEKLKCLELKASMDAHSSCSVNWKNQLFIFGGEMKRQIIKGVPVEIDDTVDHFRGHFRIPWGRNPP